MSTSGGSVVLAAAASRMLRASSRIAAFSGGVPANTACQATSAAALQSSACPL